MSSKIPDSVKKACLRRGVFVKGQKYAWFHKKYNKHVKHPVSHYCIGGMPPSKWVKKLLPRPFSGYNGASAFSAGGWSGCAKYLGWSNEIQTESLISLLWTVGVLGEECARVKKSTGFWPSPIVYSPSMAVDRVYEALMNIESFSSEVAKRGGKWSLYGLHKGGGPKVFSAEFRRYLKCNQHLKWAENLSDGHVEALFYSIGNYECRGGFIDYELPKRSKEIMMKCLYTLLIIAQGNVIPLHYVRAYILGNRQ